MLRSKGNNSFGQQETQIVIYMRVLAKIKNLQSDIEKHIIIRNFNRILDIKIIDIDIVTGMLSFVYESPTAFEQAKKELRRIGCPMINYKCSATQDTLFRRSLTNETALR